jgi:hypothetical protein
MEAPLSDDLRFPDGTADDFLAYSIRLCDDGLYQLVDPFGVGLDLADNYSNAKAFWFDAQHWREQKHWYRNLIGWVSSGICTRDELGVLVMEKRLVNLGILPQPSDARRLAAVNALGTSAQPWPEHLLRITLLREAAARGDSIASMLDAFRFVERNGGFPPGR